MTQENDLFKIQRDLGVEPIDFERDELLNQPQPKAVKQEAHIEEEQPLVKGGIRIEYAEYGTITQHVLAFIATWFLLMIVFAPFFSFIIAAILTMFTRKWLFTTKPLLGRRTPTFYVIGAVVGTIVIKVIIDMIQSMFYNFGFVL